MKHTEEPIQHRFGKKRFAACIAELKSGHLPKDMSQLVEYIEDTTKEFVEFATAVTECAIRQGTQIEMYKNALGKATGLTKEGENGGGI